MTPQPYNAPTIGWTFYRLPAPKSLLVRAVFSIACKDHLNHRLIWILWNLSQLLEIPTKRGLQAVCFWHFCQKHVHGGWLVGLWQCSSCSYSGHRGAAQTAAWGDVLVFACPLFPAFTAILLLASSIKGLVPKAQKGPEPFCVSM